MVVNPSREQQAEVEPRRPETQNAHNALIGEQVLRALGKPPDLQRVQVRYVWKAYYRVNVFVGEHIASARIANSYFVQANPEGLILDSTPVITRQY